MPELTCTAVQWLTVTGTGYPILKVQCWNLILIFLRLKPSKAYNKVLNIERDFYFADKERDPIARIGDPVSRMGKPGFSNRGTCFEWGTLFH